MNLAAADAIAKAVLYEGYLLYPYRPSAIKNRQRWTFGGIYPRSYSQAHGGSEPWEAHTECLVVGDERTRVDVRVRFLHLQARSIGAAVEHAPDLCPVDEPAFEWVESLRLDGQTHYAWQEAAEREVSSLDLRLGDLLTSPHRLEFGFPHHRETETLTGPSGNAAGAIVREQQALEGTVAVSVVPAAAGQAYKLSIGVTNHTPMPEPERLNRDEAARWAFASTHILAGVHGGEFISLLDPGDAYRQAAAECRNSRLWPILVGEAGERDLMLAAPIILYDYPQIAPESAGDLFDGTEIDELLTLRILTLTEAEKQEMRAADERGRELLERSESLPPEYLMRMHGAMRSLRPPGEQT
jgi:hypothetical protein